MNTSTTSPDTQETAHLEKLRTQISTDIEAMQQKEASLREYEQRLRLLVEHAQNSQHLQQAAQPVTHPASNSAGPDAEWEKYHRAHALLEAARRGMCDDRLALKDREERMHQRETEVARREAWVKIREQELETQAKVLAEAQPKKPAKSKGRSSLELTTAPFIAARNLLMHRKA